MYTVLIVDDEAIEREGIRLLIENHHPKFKTILEASNGYEAIDICRNTTPDLVIMDIGMPGINGIDTIRELKEFQKDSKYIILTAHSQFKYAQEAIRIGVSDFLLKPTNIQHFNELMDVIVTEIDNDRKASEAKASYLEKVTQLANVIETDCIYSIIMNSRQYDLVELVKYYDKDYKRGCVFLIRTDEDHDQVIAVLSEKLKRRQIDLIGKYIFGTHVCLCLFEDEITETDITALIDYVTLVLNVYTYNKYYLSYDSELTDFKEMRMAYKHGIEGMKTVTDDHRVVDYRQNHNDFSAKAFDYLNYTNLIFENIELGNDHQLGIVIEELFNSLYIHVGEDIGSVKSYLFEIVTMLKKMVYDYCGKKVLYDIDHNLLTAVTADLSYIRTLFKDEIDSLCAVVKEVRQNSHNKLASLAYGYIKDNYADDITLDTLSEYLLISSFYACKVIKKAFDKSFVDILSECRINQAKHLLSEKNISVKEVAYEVGFNSQHYFSKIFKKYTGKTPTEFKNL